jgi:hypothetical protein
MIKRALGCFVLLGLMGLTAGTLTAHHSLAGVYDMQAKDGEITGLVESIKFVNPHGSLNINVKNADGSVTKWTFTLGSATGLAQRGVGPTGANALHQGDKVTIKFIPARNGSPLGFLKSVTYPDGRVIVLSAGNPND